MFPTVEHFACGDFVTDPHVSSTVTQTFLGRASVQIMKNGHEILVLSKQCWIWEESWASWDKFFYVFRIKNHKTVSRFHYLKHSLWQYLIQNTACPVTQVYVKRLGSIRGITKLSLREKIHDTWWDLNRWGCCCTADHNADNSSCFLSVCAGDTVSRDSQGVLADRGTEGSSSGTIELLRLEKDLKILN